MTKFKDLFENSKRKLKYKVGDKIIMDKVKYIVDRIDTSDVDTIEYEMDGAMHSDEAGLISYVLLDLDDKSKSPWEVSYVEKRAKKIK